MNEPNPTPAVPGANPNPAAPAPSPAPEENSAIRQMRERLDTLANENKSLQAKLTEAERKDMDEKSRLAAELEDAKKAGADADKLRNELGQFQSGLERACEAAMNAVPEEKRTQIEALTKHVPIAERLAAIQSAVALMGNAPVQGGTNTQPGAVGLLPPGMPEAAKPATAEELGRMGWGAAVKASAPPAGAMPDIQKIVTDAVNAALAGKK